MDFNEIMRDPQRRADLVAGILLTGEATDLVRDWVLGTVVHTPDTTKVATLQGVEASLAQLLLKYSDKFNDKEREELADEFRQLVEGASERTAEVPEFEVTQMWLRSFAKEYGFDDGVVFRLWLMLDRNADVRKLATTNAVDLQLGPKNGFRLSQLRALFDLPDLTDINGFGVGSQAYKLLATLASHGLEVPKTDGEEPDDVTIGVIGQVAELVAEKLKLVDSSKAASRLFNLLGSSEVKKLATEQGVNLDLGPEDGYPLDAVRALAERVDVTSVPLFGRKSQSYRLLWEVVRLTYK